jgi:hypothetical protein
VNPRRYIHAFGAVTAPRIRRFGSLKSRLELRPSRTTQIKDAGRAATGAHMFVRELAARLRTPRCVVLGATLLMLLVPAVDSASAQAAGPEWKLTITPNADFFLPGQDPGVYRVEAENIGSAPTAGEITLSDSIPAGLSAGEVDFYDMELGTSSNLAGSLCSAPVGSSSVECRFPGELAGSGTSSIPPSQRLVLFVLVNVPPGVEGPLEDIAEISGGGAPSVEASTTNASSSNPPPGTLHFGASLTDAAGDPYTQAGGHPFQFTTDFGLETFSTARPSGGTTQSVREQFWASGTHPVHDPRFISAELPPGLIANPQGVPRCSLAAFFSQECEVNKVAVGDAGISLVGFSEGAFRVIEPVLNLQPSGSYPGELGITLAGLPIVTITAGVRSASDYGVTATSTTAEDGVYRVHLSLWGVPADSSHDGLRGKVCERISESGLTNVSSVAMMEEECEGESGENDAGGPAGVPPTPFLTMPTECSADPLTVAGSYDTWALPGDLATRDVEFPPVDGCNELKFEPTIAAQPTTDLADSPSGLNFDLHVPQNEDPEGVATPELKEAIVKLPAGLAVNPASGAGLAGCTEARQRRSQDAPARRTARWRPLPGQPPSEPHRLPPGRLYRRRRPGCQGKAGRHL